MLRKIEIILLVIALAFILYIVFSTENLIGQVKDLFTKDGMWIWGPAVAVMIDGFILGVLYQQRQGEKEAEETAKRIRLLELERDVWKARCRG